MSVINIKVTCPTKLPIPQPMQFVLDKSDTILSLKEKITALFPANGPVPSPQKQRLIFRGKILTDEKTINEILKDAEMESSETVHYHLALPPGVIPKNPPSSSVNTCSSSTAPPNNLLNEENIQPTKTIPLPDTKSSSSNPHFSFDSNDVPGTNQRNTLSSNLTHQVTRTQTAGICDISPYTTLRNNISVVPFEIHGKEVLIDANDIVVVSNFEGKLSCCLSPKALSKIQKALEPTRFELGLIISKTPIFNSNITRPQFNDNVNPGFVMYLGLPYKSGDEARNSLSVYENDFFARTNANATGTIPFQPQIPQPAVAAAAPPQAEQIPNQVAAQFGIGFGIGAGNQGDLQFNFRFNNRAVVIRPRHIINALILTLFCFRIFLSFGIPLGLSNVNLVALVLVLCGLFYGFDLGTILRNQFNHIIQQWNNLLPHFHPAVPNEEQQQQPQDEHQQPQRERNIHEDADQGNEEAGYIKIQDIKNSVMKLFNVIQGAVFLFIGSLVPFLYERWLREDIERRNHAENVERNRVAEQERLLQEQQQAIDNVNEQDDDNHNTGDTPLDGNSVDESKETSDGVVGDDHIEEDVQDLPVQAPVDNLIDL